MRDIFFFFPHRAKKLPVLLLDPETSGKWHTYRVPGLIENKHGEPCHEVVKKRMARGTELGHILALDIPGETSLRDHFEILPEQGRIPYRIPHADKIP